MDRSPSAFSSADWAHPFKETPRLLRKLDFLIGRFAGEGGYAHGGRSFHKSVTGTWEAGGQFLNLRMRVAYPLADGKLDVHEACVMVGVADDRLRAQVYTDAGGRHDVTLDMSGREVSFPDRPPGHSDTTRRARKILKPADDGFEELLEVDTEAGTFETYSRIVLRKQD